MMYGDSQNSAPTYTKRLSSMYSPISSSCRTCSVVSATGFNVPLVFSRCIPSSQPSGPSMRPTSTKHAYRFAVRGGGIFPFCSLVETGGECGNFARGNSIWYVCSSLLASSVLYFKQSLRWKSGNPPIYESFVLQVLFVIARVASLDIETMNCPSFDQGFAEFG